MRAARLPAALLALAISAVPVRAYATDKPSENPGKSVGPRGRGTRNVASTPSAPGSLPAAAPSGKPGEATAHPPHQKGRPPKTPSPTLPDGEARPPQDIDARHKVAGGSTAEEANAPLSDPELDTLRDAERVLFPEPLVGVEPGWSWDLPEPVDGVPKVDFGLSGLPPSEPIDTSPPRAPSLDDAKWLKTLVMPNLPVELDDRVVKYLKFYRDESRGQAISHIWAQKSGRYVAAVKAELAKAGLPTDLVWLSLIESGHNPTITSHAGAAGLWQFIPEAARMYGLTVDRWVDERLDPIRSTQAATRYLSDLHRRFGSWELAMAAYNMGHAGLGRTIRKFNSNDFWALSRYEAALPWETTLYVPKILAIAIVMNNKKAFGIEDVVPDPSVSFDTVYVEPGVPLEEVAKAAGVNRDVIEDLNPFYPAGRTPPDAPKQPKRTWGVRVPPKLGITVSSKLAKTALDPSLEAYVVRFGDTVEAIATAHDTTEDRLRSINKIPATEILNPGTVLLAPHAGAAIGASKATDDDEPFVVPARSFAYPDRRRVFYRVVSGDTLSRIAQALGVPRGDLVSWNSINESARLQAGMVLQAYVAKDANLTNIACVAEGDARVLVAGTPEFYDYFEDKNGRRRLVVTAREGETLRGIGMRYGMTAGWMERINRRSSRDKLSAGEKVVVYAPRFTPGTVASAVVVDPKPLPDVVPPVPQALPPLGAAQPSAQAPASAKE